MNWSRSSSGFHHRIEEASSNIHQASERIVQTVTTLRDASANTAAITGMDTIQRLMQSIV